VQDNPLTDKFRVAGKSFPDGARLAFRVTRAVELYHPFRAWFCAGHSITGLYPVLGDDALSGLRGSP